MKWNMLTSLRAKDKLTGITGLLTVLFVCSGGGYLVADAQNRIRSTHSCLHFFLRKAKIGEDSFSLMDIEWYSRMIGKCNVNAGKRQIKLWSFVQTILIILYDDISILVFACSFIKHGYPRIGSSSGHRTLAQGQHFFSWGDYNGDLGLYVSIQFLGQVSFIHISQQTRDLSQPSLPKLWLIWGIQSVWWGDCPHTISSILVKLTCQEVHLWHVWAQLHWTSHPTRPHTNWCLDGEVWLATVHRCWQIAVYSSKFWCLVRKQMLEHHGWMKIHVRTDIYIHFL